MINSTKLEEVGYDSGHAISHLEFDDNPQAVIMPDLLRGLDLQLPRSASMLLGRRLTAMRGVGQTVGEFVSATKTYQSMS